MLVKFTNIINSLITHNIIFYILMNVCSDRSTWVKIHAVHREGLHNFNWKLNKTLSILLSRHLWWYFISWKRHRHHADLPYKLPYKQNETNFMLLLGSVVVIQTTKAWFKRRICMYATQLALYSANHVHAKFDFRFEFKSRIVCVYAVQLGLGVASNDLSLNKN